MAPGKSPKVTTSPKVATLKKVTSPASTLFPRPFPWPGKRSWERGWPSPLPTPLPEIWPERPCCEITSRYHIVPRASPVKAGVLLRVCRCRKGTERIPCFYDITVRKAGDIETWRVHPFRSNMKLEWRILSHSVNKCCHKIPSFISEKRSTSPLPPESNEDQRLLTSHFTVVRLVTWPMTATEAGGDLALIDLPAFFHINAHLNLIYTAKTVSSVSKQGHVQPHSHSNARSHRIDHCKIVYALFRVRFGINLHEWVFQKAEGFSCILLRK